MDDTCRAARKVAVKVKVYQVVQDAVCLGVDRGWCRAHKHVDDPRPETARQDIIHAVMAELDDVLRMPD